MGYARKDVERTKMNAKKFVRYQEGAEKYSLGLTKFQELAKEAKAVYKIDKVALVNCEIFERYLETFPLHKNRPEENPPAPDRPQCCAAEQLVGEVTFILCKIRAFLSSHPGSRNNPFAQTDIFPSEQ